jgi:hypothetical protein
MQAAGVSVLKSQFHFVAQLFFIIVCLILDAYKQGRRELRLGHNRTTSDCGL